MLGYSAHSAGLAPMGVVFLVVSGFLSARFINRFGLKPILISGMILRARDHKLYLKNDNLLVSVILQLGEFENAFENLLYYIIGNIKYIRTNKFPCKNNEELSPMDDAAFLSLLQCVNILDRVPNVYTAYAVRVAEENAN